MILGKILIVDDSPDTREMIAKLLELERFTVVTAEDGRAGLDLAAAECPDLIITDINMPNLDGIEMIKILRSKPLLSNVPIMVITAYGNNFASAALSAGANYALSKPLKLDALIEGIKRLLGKLDSNTH
jgi:CheY-like chemotaxis protein